MDPMHPDYVPSIFTPTKEVSDRSKRKVKRYDRAQARDKNKKEENPGSPLPGGVHLSSSEFNTDTSESDSDTHEAESNIPRSQQPTKETQFVQTNEKWIDLEEARKKIALLEAEILLLKNKEIENSSPPQHVCQRNGIYEDIKNDESLFNFYTGLPNFQLFLWFLNLFKSEIPYKCKSLSLEDHLLLVLMKLKLGLLNKGRC